MRENVAAALHSNRSCLALTGLNAAVFNNLVPQFAQVCLECGRASRPDRQKAIGAGRGGQLRSIEEKLLFILFRTISNSGIRDERPKLV
jgi:hypothetical protein